MSNGLFPFPCEVVQTLRGDQREGPCLTLWTALSLQPSLGWPVRSHPCTSLAVPQGNPPVVPGVGVPSDLLWIPFPKMKIYHFQ